MNFQRIQHAFRKNISIESAMRQVLDPMLKRDYRAALSEIVASDSLTPEDISRIEAELPIYELAICHRLFMEYASHLDCREFTKRFALALAFAKKDQGFDDAQLPDILEPMMHSTLVYIDIPPEHFKTSGAADWFCQQFVLRVLPTGINIHNETDQRRSFEVIDVAAQVYQSAKTAFDRLTKEYRILIE